MTINRSPKLFSFGTFGLALALVAGACDPGDGLGPDDADLLVEDDEGTEVDDSAQEDVSPLPPEGNDEMPPPAMDRFGGDFPLTADQTPIGYVPTGVWFSEETPGSTCDTDWLVTGALCNGDFCDNIQLECHNFPTRTLGARDWSGWMAADSAWYVCEEDDGYVSGMTCQGDNCDDIAVECTKTGYVPEDHECTWSGWFSEEDPWFYAPFNTAVRGVQCGGSRCDNKRYRYCTI